MFYIKHKTLRSKAGFTANHSLKKVARVRRVEAALKPAGASLVLQQLLVIKPAGASLVLQQ